MEEGVGEKGPSTSVLSNFRQRVARKPLLCFLDVGHVSLGVDRPTLLQLSTVVFSVQPRTFSFDFLLKLDMISCLVGTHASFTMGQASSESLCRHLWALSPNSSLRSNLGSLFRVCGSPGI